MKLTNLNLSLHRVTPFGRYTYIVGRVQLVILENATTFAI